MANRKIATMVTAPIEPDASAAMVQAAINPGELVGDALTETKYQVLPNTLVFTRVVKNMTASVPQTGPPLKRPRSERERFPQVVGGGFDPKYPLYVLGVAYDGIPNTAAAMHWPNERGRLVAQVTGTCTIAMISDDLNELEILDKLEIDRSRATLTTAIAAVNNYSMPKIKRFDALQKNNRESFLALFLTDTEIENFVKTNTMLSTWQMGNTKIAEVMKAVGYEEIYDNFKNVRGDPLKEILENLRKMVEADLSPFAVLLEKGHECARILLTPA